MSPLPVPMNSESQREWMSRCMGDQTMMNDYSDHTQRLAVCFRQWDLNKSEADMERKIFSGIELKQDKPGSFMAKIAELNVKDKDKDWTLPGAFPEGKEILISSYQHGSWNGDLPVGKGVIHEMGNHVIVEGQFNLNTSSGKEHYEAVKFAPQLVEWSYGFKVLEYGEDKTLADQGVERILKKLDVFEASPVLLGAGVNTACLSIKSEKSAIPFKETPKAPESDSWDAAAEVAAASVDDLKIMCAIVQGDPANKTSYKLPHHKAGGQHSVVWKGVAAAGAVLVGSRGGVDASESDKAGARAHLAHHYKEFGKTPPWEKSNDEGVTFADQSEAALVTVEDLIERSKALAAMRAKEGRTLSAASRERIGKLRDKLTEIQKEMETLLTETDPGKAEKLFLEISRLKTEFYAEVN